MGYDCTLHVLDENIIRDRFIPRLLGESDEVAPFDQWDDAKKNWATVRESLQKLEAGSETPHSVASLISQLAIAYVAAELPYHYERGFCLSLWDSHQEEAVTVTFPKKHRGNPETLFEDVIRRYPMLQKQLPTEIESNFCPGIYIPFEKVPAALKWVEKTVNSFPKAERRLFRGLILVLKEAAKRGKGYWEGSDLPVPMATMYPPESDRVAGLEEWKNPHGIYMDFRWQDGPILLFADETSFPQDCRTVRIDVRKWPPHSTAVWNEYSRSVAKSSDGKWVTASMTSEQEWMYRARVRTSISSQPVVLLPPEERKNGLTWAGFLGNQVVAVLDAIAEYPNAAQGDYSVEHLTPAYTLLEDHGRLIPIAELPRSPNKFPTMGTITLGDGSHVFIWDSIGYEFKSGQFAPAFTIPGRWSTQNKCTWVSCGVDGFFCVCETVSGKIDELTYTYGEQGLFSVQRGQECRRHLPKVTRIRGIAPGPAGSVLVHEPNEHGDLGKLFFPDDQTYLRIEPDIFVDEDPLEIRSLHYVQDCERLIAATSTRLWARPIEHILVLPRYNAASGRLQRSKSS